MKNYIVLICSLLCVVLGLINSISKYKQNYSDKQLDENERRKRLARWRTVSAGYIFLLLTAAAYFIYLLKN